MLDLQAYRDGKKVFYRSGLWFSDAFEYLEVKRNIQVDSIDVQFYTDDGKNAMPLDGVEDLQSVQEAQRWINQVFTKTILKKYDGVRYDKDRKK
jgi:hypothetical protein